jgi:hypothetical protein
LRILKIPGQGVVDGLLVGEKPRRVFDIVEGSELLLADVDAPAFSLTDARLERLRLLEEPSGGFRIVEPGVNVAQPRIGHG